MLRVKLGFRDLQEADKLAVRYRAFEKRSEWDGNLITKRGHLDLLTEAMRSYYALACLLDIKPMLFHKFDDYKTWFANRNRPTLAGIWVRTTHHRHGKLLMQKKDDKEHLYALALSYDNPTFCFPGYAWSEMLALPRNWCDLARTGHYCYALSQHKLLPMKTLVREFL